MKSVNNILLDKRKEAMMFSKIASQNKNVFKAPLEVKKRRSKLGSVCGSIVTFVAVLLYIINVPNLSIGLFVVGLLTLGINLVLLNFVYK
ncbi:hypothetical protein NHI66_001033 [Clostridium botulinum]|nr:hypothetical protein [Clostridium botulinum]